MGYNRYNKEIIVINVFVLIETWHLVLEFLLHREGLDNRTQEDTSLHYINKWECNTADEIKNRNVIKNF